MTHSILRRSLAIAITSIVLTACGGGGGGGGTTPPPPPPPPSSVDYTVSLTSVTLGDRQTNGSISAGGLPITGATVTRSQ